MFDIHLAEIDGKRIDFDLKFLKNEYPNSALANQLIPTNADSYVLN
mgnify:CR=1 FL=1